MNKKHNLRYHPLYGVWVDMKGRCYCVTDSAYKNYGAKGVIICEEWRYNFKTFYDWAILNGWKDGLQIDKDKLSPSLTGKIYSPDFCSFLSRSENMKYRSNSKYIVYKGENKLLKEWCNILGVSYYTSFRRLRDGWTIEKTFATNCKENMIRNKNKSKLTNVN